MFYLAIFLVVYAVACYLIAFTKTPKIWNMGKIQAFVKILGEIGTQIFIIVFGSVALGFGIWLLIKHWPA